MATKLTTKAPELGTYAITSAFVDEGGDPVTPNSATWTLTDRNGTVINSRQDVAIGSLSTTVTILLTGNDLQITAGVGANRFLLVEGVYDSSLGSDLPLRAEVEFDIEEFVAVSGTV